MGSLSQAQVQALALLLVLTKTPRRFEAGFLS